MDLESGRGGAWDSESAHIDAVDLESACGAVDLESVCGVDGDLESVRVVVRSLAGGAWVRENVS